MEGTEIRRGVGVGTCLWSICILSVLYSWAHCRIHVVLLSHGGTTRMPAQKEGHSPNYATDLFIFHTGSLENSHPTALDLHLPGLQFQA